MFWLALAAVARFPGKLTGAEKNDSSSWLPPKAEFTQILDLRSEVVISPNVYSAVVAYGRLAGLTAAGKAKAAADVARFDTCL